MNKESPIKITQQLAEQGVVLAYLHGSRARGDNRQDSDLDIAVLLDSNIKEDDYLDKILKISVIFNEVYPENEIDIVVLNNTTPLFAQSVASEGIVLFAQSDDIRIMFENRALHEYEDTRRLRKIYNEVLSEKIKNL